MTKQELWERFQQHYTEFPNLGLAIDISRMNFPDKFFAAMEAKIQHAFVAMKELEGGAIANPDEKRMVGHYWLRNPALAPTKEIRLEIERTLSAVKAFAKEVHDGMVKGSGGIFKNLLVVGIGGSALGPQFVANALGHPKTDRLKVYFFDNTDPDGMDRVLASMETELGQTLVVVISKSGGTKETRNGMLEAQAAFAKAGIKFAAQAVAVTGLGSELDQVAIGNGWLKRFPMWDWVGGRTSELSAVGLLPAALQGLDVDQMLAGARECDEVTRSSDVKANPAAQMALMWHFAGNGKGEKDLVVLPYKDRLELFSKYLQQLMMESLGKAQDLEGKTVATGIAVYGNKGSTDQHAYVQQLRDGLNNFFVTFIEVQKDRQGVRLEVEPGITSGDFLNGFLLGTRQALFDNDRQSITLTIKNCSAHEIGVLIALFERSVGFYASLININAYHQPGVEAGKKAAGAVIAIKTRAMDYLQATKGKAISAAEIAQGIRSEDEVETVFKVCEHLAANSELVRTPGKAPIEAKYSLPPRPLNR
ncbi:MAG: glucose-6-phosphate isomerase [Opitutaceae bacterium]|nr:glucose-6-phosphate isomerase [Verrucomicrobiales bacterium]